MIITGVETVSYELTNGIVMKQRDLETTKEEIITTKQKQVSHIGHKITATDNYCT